MSAHARDRIAVGTSAGGIQALSRVLEGLPRDLPAALFVVMHRSPMFPSLLAEVLGRSASLPVREPEYGETIERGVVYVAPADRHMTVRDDRIVLDRSPKQHHTRPAIDPLFRSLAAECGPRVVGVLLTGNLSDGVAGLVAIKAAGGLTVVQDPAEAQFPSMPYNALLYDHVDLVLRLAAAPEVLPRLARGEDVDAIVEDLAEHRRHAKDGGGAGP